MNSCDVPFGWRDLIWKEPLGRVFQERDRMKSEIEEAITLLRMADPKIDADPRWSARRDALIGTRQDETEVRAKPTALAKAALRRVLRNVTKGTVLADIINAEIDKLQ